MIANLTSATAPRSAFWRHSALVLGVLALLLAAFPAMAGAQTPADKQYDGGVPGAGGGSKSAGGQAGGGEGRGNQDGASGKGKKGEKKAGEESGKEGDLTASFAESDDGGLSTLAIILIVLAVIAAAALAYVWWRGREVGGGPEPPGGGPEPPGGGPEPPAA